MNGESFMQVQLKNILQEAKEQLLKASSIAETEEIRVKLLGKKGSLTEILRSMGSLKPEERKEFGKAANSVRAEIEGMLENKFKSLKELQKKERFAAEKIDVTEPGAKISLGVKHPISITIDEISRVFTPVITFVLFLLFIFTFLRYFVKFVFCV
jgi:phenylalanyl-tRNA synthetase alpha chain